MVKLFADNHFNFVESSINTWLENNIGIEVFDIKYSVSITTDEALFSALVHYKKI